MNTTMMQNNLNNNGQTKNDEGNNNHQEASILPFAMDGAGIIVGGVLSTSPRSTAVVSMSDDGIESSIMMPVRERFDSFDSTASSSSTFSLVPRRSNFFGSRPTTPSSKHSSKGLFLVPQTAERPIIEFSFGDNNDEIPDHLLVPVL